MYGLKSYKKTKFLKVDFFTKHIYGRGKSCLEFIEIYRTDLGKILNILTKFQLDRVVAVLAFIRRQKFRIVI